MIITHALTLQLMLNVISFKPEGSPSGVVTKVSLKICECEPQSCY